MRALLLAGGLSLGTLALGGLSPAMAHVGHGDEFQQQGNVRQVKASAEIDFMLGITTAPATEAGGVVSIPVAAVVDADGKPLRNIHCTASPNKFNRIPRLHLNHKAQP